MGFSGGGRDLNLFAIAADTTLRPSGELWPQKQDLRGHRRDRFDGDIADFAERRTKTNLPSARHAGAHDVQRPGDPGRFQNGSTGAERRRFGFRYATECGKKTPAGYCGNVIESKKSSKSREVGEIPPTPCRNRVV